MAEYKWMQYYNSLKDGYNVTALPGQKICLEDIDSEEKYFFSTFKDCEAWLHKQGITTGVGLEPFLKKSIKSKNLIYQHFIIYYWKE